MSKIITQLAGLPIKIV